MSLLSVRDISVSFGGLNALTDVSLDVERGQVVGLIGPNGAGKTTLLGVISGLQRCKRGRVEFNGTDITGLPTYRRARLGMSRTFQRLELWNSLSVRENIKAAAEFSKAWRRSVDPDAKADDLLARMDLRSVAHDLTGTLPSGLARVVEVARALASEPELLLLDEPSAGLDSSESRELSAVLRDVNAQGTAILLVEHHVEMVMSLCSAIWVLDFGRTIGNGPPEEVRELPAVQAAYLGVAQ